MTILELRFYILSKELIPINAHQEMMCSAQQYSSPEEYIQYTQEVEQIITHLEHNLHDTDDPD